MSENLSYHISQQGVQLGEMPEAEIISQLAAGRLHPADHAWRIGMEEWQPLSSLFAHHLQPPPAPAGKISTSDLGSEDGSSEAGDLPASGSKPKVQIKAARPLQLSKVQENASRGKINLGPGLMGGDEGSGLGKAARPVAPTGSLADVPPPVSRPSAPPPLTAFSGGTSPALPKPVLTVKDEPLQMNPGGGHYSLNPGHLKPYRRRRWGCLVWLLLILTLLGGLMFWAFQKYGSSLLYQGALSLRQKDPVRFGQEGAVLLTEAAKMGDVQAQVELALCHLRADGVARDVNETLRLLKTAADEGKSARAQALYAGFLMRGQGVSKDFVQAKEYAVKALADDQEPEAQFQMASWYSLSPPPATQEEVEKNLEKYVEHLEKAATMAHAGARATLGVLKMNGPHASEKEREEGMDLIRRAADVENAIGQGFLGLCAKDGDGMKADAELAEKSLLRASEAAYTPAIVELILFYLDSRRVDDAMKWAKIGVELDDPDIQRFYARYLFKKADASEKDIHQGLVYLQRAAELGDAIAQTDLGVRLQAGNGLAKDEATGLRWIQKAVAQKHPEALLQLAYCYEHGRGLAADSAAAYRHFGQAAELGDPAGHYMCGNYHYYGRGMPKDFAQAIMHFMAAGEQRHAGALYMYSLCLTNGEGVSKDEAQAVEYLRAAAEQSFPAAQYALGYFMETGKGGVTRDPEEALRLYRLAASQGDPAAKKRLEELAVGQ